MVLIFKTTLEAALKGILEVGNASFEHFYSKETLFERLDGRKHWIYVKRDKGLRIIGFKIFYEDDDHQIYDWLDAVHPDHRRQGIAKKLMSIQFEEAKSLGYSRVRLETHEGHPEMIALCKKMRFYEWRERELNHWGDGRTAIFLQRNL